MLASQLLGAAMEMRIMIARVIVAALCFSGLLAESAYSQTLQAGFQQATIFTGLSNPTAIKFASDGRVFLAEKSRADQSLR